MTATSLLAVAGLLPMVSANMVLRQLHVISRQGSSTTVTDGNANQEALSAVGETQMTGLGEWIRNEFQDVPTSLLDQYFPTRVRFESSALDTPIISAQSLARGLFPLQADKIPVFTQSARNDITIASHEQCPSFMHAINTLHTGQNTEWHEMEVSHMGLLTELASLPVLDAYALQGSEGPYIPLQSVAKIYDMIREAKITCLEGYDSFDVDACAKLPFPHAAALLTDEEWVNLKALVRFTEVESTYGSERGSRLIANNLLRQVLDRMLDDEMNPPTDVSSKNLFVTLADYPALIAVLGALKAGPDDKVLDDVIPGYGSAIIFELYQDDKTLNHEVRVLYKAAGDAHPVVLRMGDHCYDMGGCEMNAFTAHLEGLLMGTRTWCQECENGISDICLFYTGMEYQEKLRDEQAKAIQALENVTDSATGPFGPAWNNQNEGNEFAAVFIGGIAVGAVVMVLISLTIKCLRRENGGSTSSGKKHPRTPPTAKSGHSAAFWERDDGQCDEEEIISPTSSEDLDADELSMHDEDEDRSGRGSASPLRFSTPKFSNMPSKRNFPPEIV